MKRFMRIIFGIVISVSPFVVLWTYAAFDKTCWNPPNPDNDDRLAAAILMLVALFGTMPFVLFIRKRMASVNHSIVRNTLRALAYVAYSGCYLTALYGFFMLVAFHYDHISI